MTQHWAMTHSLTNTSISNAADVGMFYKIGVSAETWLVINWLTKVVNCAENWTIVSVELITFLL